MLYVIIFLFIYYFHAYFFNMPVFTVALIIRYLTPTDVTLAISQIKGWVNYLTKAWGMSHK